MKEFAVYTAARLVLFVVSYALVAGCYVLVTGSRQLPLIWPFVLAVVISAIASALLLRKQRDQFALAVQRRAARASERFEAARAKEDEPDS